MKCDEVRRMLDAYVDGELDLTRRVDVETHLPDCVNCKDAAEDITQFCSLVRMNAPVYKGPPELRAKIRAALRKESKPRAGWFSRFSLPLAYAAAGLALSFGLTWTWRTFSPAKDQALVAQAISNRHGNNVINLFVWPASIRKIDLNVRSDRGYHFCGWNKAGLNYFCISEISSIGLEAFEDQVREHTNL